MTWRLTRDKYFPFVPIAKIPITMTRAKSWPLIPLRWNHLRPLVAEVDNQEAEPGGDVDVTLLGITHNRSSRLGSHPFPTGRDDIYAIPGTLC